MKTSPAADSARIITSRQMSQKSLLTLASGAAALGVVEQPGQADIIYSSFNATVGFGVGQVENYSLAISGGPTMHLIGVKSAQLIVAKFSSSTTYSGKIARQPNGKSALPSHLPGTEVAFRTIAGNGNNWNNQSRTGSITFANIIRAHKTGTVWKAAGPGGFDSSKYLLFTFQNAGTTEYGWVGMSGATWDANDKTKMSVTFTGWAYDNSGAMINAGEITAVPEASTGLGALVAAMVVGGAALRRWRKSKLASIGQPG